MMVSQGGFGATASGGGVKEIYSALFGVSGNKVDPAAAIFPAGGPPSGIPKIDTKGSVAKKAVTK